MKHAREDYNRIQDPLGKIPQDEPVFLLRGQDKLAPQLLLEWANLLEAMGGDPEMANKVRTHAGEMIEWQRMKKMKLPDMPEYPETECPSPKKENFQGGPSYEISCPET